ncbi:prepilin peptidase [Gymnodinialimonas sp.]
MSRSDPRFTTSLGSISLPISIFVHLLAYGIVLAFFGKFNDPYVVAFSAILIWVSVVDFDRFEVPNLASLLLVALGIFIGQPLSHPVCSVVIVSILIWPILFYLISELYLRRVGVQGLGMGDVKLILGLSIWLPFDLMSVAILVGSVSAIAALLVLRAARSATGNTDETSLGIAFGPFLCFPAIVLFCLDRVI